MTDRQEFFIKREFGVYDSGLLVVLGNRRMHLYEVLRRFVWRSKEVRDDLRRYVKDGKLVAKVRQQLLADYLGLERTPRISEDLQMLYELGWVQKEKPLQEESGGVVNIYALGQFLEDQNGRRHEVFYADAWVRELLNHLDSVARQEMEDGSVTMMALPIKERIELTRAFIIKSGARLLETDGRKVSTGPRVPEASDPGGHLPPTPHPETGSRKPGTDNPDTPYRWSSATGRRLPPRARPAIRKPGTEDPESDGYDTERASTFTFEGKGPLRLGVMDPYAGGYPLSREAEVEKSLSTVMPDAAASGADVGGGEDPGLDAEPEQHEAAQDEAALVVEPQEAALGEEHGESALAVRPADGKLLELHSVVAEAARRSAAQLRANAERSLKRKAQADQKASNLQGKPIVLSERKQLKRCEEIWQRELRSKYPGIDFAAWGAEERGKCRHLLTKYPGEIVEHALNYLVAEWEGINARLLKGKGSVPSLGLLVKVHDILVPESQTWQASRDVIDEYQRWFKANPGNPYPPEDLERRYRQATQGKPRSGATDSLPPSARGR